MANAVMIRYVGFRTTSNLREYTFLVKEGADEACEYKLTIPNAAFLSHRARYQDAPDICAQRVQRELDSSGSHPVNTHCAITEGELEAYRSAHSPKPRMGGMYKPPSAY